MSSLIQNKSGSVLSQFFDIDRFFDEPAFKRFDVSVPAVNVKESDSAFTVEVNAPGFSKDELKVEIKENVMHISAFKKQENEERNEQYTRREFSSSSFNRSFSLPANILEENMKASYENGILFILIPKNGKTPKEIKRQISIL
jgi:HSP20 family protein